MQKKSSQGKNAIERAICLVPDCCGMPCGLLYICIYYRKYEQKYLREVQRTCKKKYVFLSANTYIVNCLSTK
jgi:hypothetical protein